MLLAGVEEGPKRQTWNDCLSVPPILPLPLLLGRVAGSLTVLGCVSSASFLLGVIEISKFNGRVEICQLVVPESKRGPRRKENVKELLKCGWYP